MKLQNLQRKYLVLPWQSCVFLPIPMKVPANVTCESREVKRGEEWMTKKENEIKGKNNHPWITENYREIEVWYNKTDNRLSITLPISKMRQQLSPHKGKSHFMFLLLLSTENSKILLWADGEHVKPVEESKSKATMHAETKWIFSDYYYPGVTLVLILWN